MVILFVVDYYQPKIGYGSYYIPKELARLGHKVTILTSNYYYPFPNYNETAGKVLGPRKISTGSIVSNGVKVVRNKIWFEFFTRAFFGGHVSMVKRVRPDIVIVDKTAGYSQVVMALLKPIYKFRLISIDAHLPSGFMAEGNLVAKEMFYTLFRFFFSGLLNRLVDKFIAVQEETVTIMKKYYGIKAKMVHIPLGTDIFLFKKSPTWKKKIRAKYNIKNRDFVIIYTGKIIKEKGIDILFKSLSILLRKHKNIKLLLVGAGPKEYIRYCFDMLDKGDVSKVNIVGFVEAKDLYKYYSAADLAVWPLQESMSMNDAASCSIPFIANDTIGAKFRIKNDNAILYKKGNYKDLANKINTLYLKPKKAIKMGENGRELMESELSWSIIAQKYIS